MTATPVTASVSSLRARHRRGTLDGAYTAVYDRLTPGWSDTHADRDRAADLVALAVFISRERHSDVPVDHTENGRAVGAFTRRVRAQHAEGLLAAATVETLDQISGWEWSTTEARWRRAVGHLLAWARTHRGCELTGTTKHGDFALGRWWAGVTVDIAAGRLSPKHEAEALACWQAWG